MLLPPIHLGPLLPLMGIHWPILILIILQGLRSFIIILNLFLESLYLLLIKYLHLFNPSFIIPLFFFLLSLQSPLSIFNIFTSLLLKPLVLLNMLFERIIFNSSIQIGKVLIQLLFLESFALRFIDQSIELLPFAKCEAGVALGVFEVEIHSH